MLMIEGQECDLYSDLHDYSTAVILKLKNLGPSKRQAPHKSSAFLNAFSALGCCKMWVTWWADVWNREFQGGEESTDLWWEHMLLPHIGVRDKPNECKGQSRGIYISMAKSCYTLSLTNRLQPLTGNCINHSVTSPGKIKHASAYHSSSGCQ